jgi:hypothetical protein
MHSYVRVKEQLKTTSEGLSTHDYISIETTVSQFMKIIHI